MNAEHRRPFAHLLCAVDGTEPSCRAASFAASLARAFDARLTFLVIASRAQATAELDRFREIEGVEEFYLSMVAPETDGCLRTAVEIARSAGVANADARIMTGEAASTICEAAGALAVDCIVLGRGRRGALSRAVRASIGERVAHRCNFPVLSIP